MFLSSFVVFSLKTKKITLLSFISGKILLCEPVADKVFKNTFLQCYCWSYGSMLIPTAVTGLKNDNIEIVKLFANSPVFL